MSVTFAYLSRFSSNFDTFCFIFEAKQSKFELDRSSQSKVTDNLVSTKVVILSYMHCIGFFVSYKYRFSFLDFLIVLGGSNFTHINLNLTIL